MIPTDVRFLAKACGGEIIGNCDARVYDVKIDSRECLSGDMFVCVIGPANDGHRYMKQAYDGGARVFLISNREAGLELLKTDPEITLILAENTDYAFKDMAQAYLAQFDLKKIAITGSVGKTSTRILTAAVLSKKYRVVSAKNNLNTYWGLCITAFSADETTEIIVFEMGMDRRGEIVEYCEWVRPDTAVITNIGITHLEKLGTREEIAREKLSITKFLKPDDYIVYDCDGDYLRTEEEARSRMLAPCRIMTTGTGSGADLRYGSVVDRGVEGVEFEAEFEGKKYPVHLTMLGAHNASNAALAMAVGTLYGITPEEAAEGLHAAHNIYRRMDARMSGEVFIIDDTYNASPASMRSALETFRKIQDKRKIAILGDMLELGSAEKDSHIEMGEVVAESGLYELVTIGNFGDWYSEKAKKDRNLIIKQFKVMDEAEPYIRQLIKPGDAVLIKGSNITGVAGLAVRLRALYEGRE